MSNHTPGPWTAERQDDDSGYIYWAIHAHANYEFITNVHDSKANAQLIAAAPDLAEALTAMVNACGPHPTMLVDEADKLARAALRKARPE